MKSKFKNHFNANEFPKGMEKPNILPDLAVPNQSLTISEIYLRYASGRSVPGVNTQFDDDGTSPYPLDFDDYMPNIETLDLADRQSIIEEAKAQLDEVKKKLNAVAAGRKREAEKREADLQKRLKNLEELKTPPPAPSAGGVDE